jgi:hypothetical protein
MAIAICNERSTHVSPCENVSMLDDIFTTKWLKDLGLKVIEQKTEFYYFIKRTVNLSRSG